MPSRKQKSRKRKDRTKCTDSLAIIRRFLPSEQKLFPLVDFVKQYAPFLKLCEGCDLDTEMKTILERMVVAPLESAKPVLHIKSAVCQEPVPSLIDDVVWSLVQRRDRWKRLPDKDGRNVLAQGYSTAPPQHFGPAAGMTFPSIRPGLTQWRPNDNVTFCKTSRIFQHLHRYVGDEVLRMILLHARLFVPLDDHSVGTSRGNYTLVCGPPLTNGPVSRIQLTDVNMSLKHKINVSTGRPVKRRRRDHPDQQTDLQANQSLSRYNMFYSDSFTPKVGLHQKHPFSDPSITPERLLASVTATYGSSGARRRKRWKRVRRSGIEIFKRILALGRKCDYHRILEHYCPLPRHRTLPYFGAQDDSEALKVLVQSYSTLDGVVSFVRSVLFKVFPLEFWGSQRNLDSIMEVVKTFVYLRRKERLSNKRLMYGIRTNDLVWLHGNKNSTAKLSRTDHEATCTLALSVLRWLFRGFIMPLLRSVFYATETEFSCKRVLYYRKPVWSAFRSFSLNKLLKEQFRELSRQQVVSYLRSHRIGFSRLRLLPKKTGVRPIAQLSRLHPVSMEDVLRTPKRTKLDSSTWNTHSSTDSEVALMPVIQSGNHRDSANAILTQIFDILTYEAGRREDPFGSGLKGLADFYPKYQEYIRGLRHELGKGRPLNLIFASVDIEKCYDNIDQNIIYDITKRQISHDDYLIQKYNVLYGDDVTGGVRRFIKKRVGPPESHAPLYHQDTNGVNVLAQHFRDAVLDSRGCEMVPRVEIVSLLQEHLHGHLVATSGRFGQRYLLQTGGISQGSILSMLLCNLYYGCVEDLLLNDENPQSPDSKTGSRLKNVDRDFLARLVDDFLFVSTSKPAVCNFLKRMWTGNVELGVQINRDKTIVSEALTFQVDGSTSPIELPVAQEFFPWCGMLFNTRTGEVAIDYERFYNGKTQESLTVDFDGSEGRKLGVRMESYVRPRCVPILFDPLINSRSAIIINYYQIMLFGAAKTAEHLRSTDVCPTIKKNEDFILKCIDSLAAYSGRQIRCNLRHQARDETSFVLDDHALLWLTWHAFSKVYTQLDNFGSLGLKILARFQLKGRPDVLNSVPAERTLAIAYDRFALDRIIQL
jgi:Telomerase ribonucleoprotein complex - RNA binding domain